MSEQKLKKKVISHLEWDNRVDASDIVVEVEDSTVILNGIVPNYRVKNAAFNDAWAIEGVTSVVSNLVVEYVPHPDEDALTDDKINNRAIDKIAFNSTLSLLDIEVEVEKKWVTLKGTVNAYWQKYEAEVEVEDVAGVVGVTNALVVAPEESKSDELVAKDISKAMQRDTNIVVDRINVKVEGGVVSLTGTVPNYLEKSAAFDIAAHTAGVIEVTDMIEVEGLYD